MRGPSRLLVVWCALLVTACGAGDNRLDPSDLELRDVLGMSPETASAWDAGQRAAARRVIEGGLREVEAPVRATFGAESTIDQRIARALASADGERANRDAAALGLVHVAIGPGELLATPRVATLAPRPIVEIELAGWDAESLRPLPARGMDVLSALATQAGHAGGPVVVAPAPRLAVIAGYVPATASTRARLVVNPVLLAALEPPSIGGSARGAFAAASSQARTAGSPTPPTAPTIAIAADGAGNPYSFYGSVAECAAAQRARCDGCVPSASCSPITSLGDGTAECSQLAANGGRGYFLICINLALAIDSVSTCTAHRAPTCSFDPHASDSISTLETNAKFLDDATCGGPLDLCLASIFGSPDGTFGGPGSDAGTGTPRNTSIDCSDSSCDFEPDCELDGPSCDDTQSCDGACADSNEQSGCDDSGGGGGGGCSGDNEDSCGADNSSSCDNGDCGGSSSGGDCGGSDCGGGGGGDCGGGGGDCSGGGGDCGGGGGGDCNVGAKRGHGTANISILWAFLPIPFARMAKRRARRRRAREEVVS